MLLSHEPLDPCTVAYHNALHNPIETPKLSHSPYVIRVYLTKTGDIRRAGMRGCSRESIQLQVMRS